MQTGWGSFSSRGPCGGVGALSTAVGWPHWHSRCLSTQDSCVRTAGVTGHLCGGPCAGHCAHGLCSESWEVLCSRTGPHWAVCPCGNAAPCIAGCVFGCLLDSSGPYMHTSLSRLSSAPHLLRGRVSQGCPIYASGVLVCIQQVPTLSLPSGGHRTPSS